MDALLAAIAAATAFPAAGTEPGRPPDHAAEHRAAPCAFVPLAAAGPQQGAAEPQARTRPPPQPFTESELDALVRSLEPVPLKTGDGTSTRIAQEGSSLGPERLADVLGDVTALLAGLHAQDALEALKRAPELDAPSRARLEKDLGGVIGCTRRSFAARGGDPAWNRALELVGRRRDQLEPLLLRQLVPTPVRSRRGAGQ